MKLALNLPILEFTNNGLQTWISRVTQLHDFFYFRLPIQNVLLLSHGNMVNPFQCPIQYLHVLQYPEILEALLDRCLEQVSPCATVARPFSHLGLQIVRIKSPQPQVRGSRNTRLIIYRACVVGDKNEQRFLIQFVDMSTGVNGCEFSIHPIFCARVLTVFYRL